MDKRKLMGKCFSIVNKFGKLFGKKDGVRILTYHRVNDYHPEDRLSVSVNIFKKQMQYLKENGYKTITLEDYIVNKYDDSKIIVLTFDDGYADNFEFAIPVLKELYFTATIFIVTGLVGTENTTKRYRYAQSDVDRIMTWDEVKMLREDGFEIGSHTVSHPYLDKVDDNKAKQEIFGSNCDPDGNIFNTFCYPAGKYTSNCVKMVKNAGYIGAVTTCPGDNFPSDDPFLLTRTEISGFDTMDIFKLKIEGAFDLPHQIWQMFNK